MQKINKILFVAVGSIFLFSCQEKEESALSSQMKFSINQETLSAEEKLEHVNAFLFDNESLVKKFTNMQSNSEGLYVMGTDMIRANKLLFVAGDHGIDFETLFPDYDQLKAMVVREADFVTSFPNLFYTGERSMSNITNTTLDLSLIRSIARLDLKKITQLEVIVDSCVLSNLADRSYLLPGNATSPESVQYKRQSIQGDALTGLDQGLEGVAYLYESSAQAPQVTLYTRINGVKNKLNVTLPEKIERNKRYEIAINSNGAVVFTDLQVLPWGDGGSSTAKPEDFTPLIDLENSEFPEGVRPSQSLDTLFIAAGFEGSFTLGLDAPVETETKLESSHVAVTPIASTKSTYTGNKYRMEVKKSDVNQSTLIADLQVKSVAESQYYDKQIVIVKESYRTRFDGLTGPITGNNVVYSTYKDGDMGIIFTRGETPIVSVSTRSTDSQFDWLRITESEQGKRLEGGFKPNDIEATGQQQTSIVTVNYTDGLTEEFTFTRQRSSIPVITQGGLYWAKYNMRGNSKSYEDQIGFDRDVPRGNFYEFLKTCSDEDLVYYAGAAYRGKSTDGLYLAWDSEKEKHLYNGYSSIPDGQISNGPADSHCPAGYEIASLADWQRIWYTGGQMNLPVHGASDHYNSSTGDNRYRMSRFTRDSVVVDGHVLPTVNFLMIEDVRNYAGEQMVFTGLASQSSASNIVYGQFIYPIITTGPTHFLLDFNTRKSSYGNLSGSGVHTRMIRCVKSPVTYIVE